MKENNTGSIIIVCLIILLVAIFNNKITDELANMVSQKFELQTVTYNEYSKDKEYLYFSIPKDNIPLSKKELLGIIYNTINAKQEMFSFYCPSEYTKCLSDINDISTDSVLLMHINNFVHPYNSFTTITFTTSESGEVDLEVQYLYNNEEIAKINKKVDEIIKSEITKDMDDYDKIKAIHDYIINNTKYDVDKNTNNNSKYDSHKATSTLLDGYAICNGYADSMAIFLSKLGYDNYKIATAPIKGDESSTGHVWNAVYIDGQWKHLDLTWDDPVSSDGKDYLYHKYFLVSNEEMAEADSGKVEIKEHNFDKSIYLEFKEA